MAQPGLLLDTIPNCVAKIVSAKNLQWVGFTGAETELMKPTVCWLSQIADICVPGLGQCCNFCTCESGSKTCMNTATPSPLTTCIAHNAVCTKSGPSCCQNNHHGCGVRCMYYGMSSDEKDIIRTFQLQFAWYW